MLKIPKAFGFAGSKVLIPEGKWGVFLPEDTAIFLLNGKLSLLLGMVGFLRPLTLLQAKEGVNIIDRVLNSD